MDFTDRERQKLVSIPIILLFSKSQDRNHGLIAPPPLYECHDFSYVHVTSLVLGAYNEDTSSWCSFIPLIRDEHEICHQLIILLASQDLQFLMIPPSHIDPRINFGLLSIATQLLKARLAT